MFDPSNEWLLWAFVFAGLPFGMWFLGYVMGAREERQNLGDRETHLKREVAILSREIEVSREVKVPPSKRPKRRG